MRYMLMLYADQKAGAAIPKADMDKAMETMFAYQRALEKAGAFVATSALGPVWDAKTIRMEGGKVTVENGTFLNRTGELKVHDGPYAETREQFGGYFIIEAPDMDAAVEWAKKCPSARGGTIEVRPIWPTRGN